MTAAHTATGPVAGPVPAPAADPPRPARRRRRAGLAPYLFLAPGFTLFVAFIIYPTLRAFQISFYDWGVMAGSVSRFLGFDNYSRAFHDAHFWLSLFNSGIYMLLTVPPQIALGLCIALLLKAKSPVQPLFRVLFYLPVVTSWVVVSLLFKFLFADGGLVNYTLGGFLHVTDVFAEGGEAFLLEAVMLGGEIAIGLGVLHEHAKGGRNAFVGRVDEQLDAFERALEVDDWLAASEHHVGARHALGAAQARDFGVDR